MKIDTRNFQFKLALSYLVVIVLSLGLAAYYLDKNLEENALKEIKSSLLKETRLVEEIISSEGLAGKAAGGLDSLIKALGPKTGSRITVMDNQGTVLADSDVPAEEVPKMENHARRPEVKAALGGGEGDEVRYSSTVKIDMLYMALPIREGGRVAAVVRMALPLTSVKKTLYTVRYSILASLIFALALAFVVGSLLASGVVRPMNRIIRAVSNFAKGDFRRKIFVDSKDEVGELSETLNRMAGAIEEKIRETNIQNQQLKAIFQSMIEGIIVTDRKGGMVSMNPAAISLFNIGAADTAGMSFLEVIRNNDIAEIIGSVLKNGRFRSAEIDMAWPVRRALEVNASPIFSGDAISGCLAVFHDITEIRRLETMRRDFVANVSHELKTPLTSIKGFVETLLEGALEDKENAAHFLKIISEHANRLDNLVKDLLALSYLESAEAAISPEDVDMKRLADEVLSGFEAGMKRRSISARNELPEGALFKADKNKMEQVFVNLIDNAVKFNKDGGSIRIYSEKTAAGTRFIVEDSGTGIPPKDIPRIFERFYRVDKARSRSLGGTGLGLSIVKHIVSLHGGTVGVESAEEIGSKFYLTLPK